MKTEIWGRCINVAEIIHLKGRHKLKSLIAIFFSKFEIITNIPNMKAGVGGGEQSIYKFGFVSS